MFFPNTQLNTRVFENRVEKSPTRKGYGLGLLRAGEENRNVVALSADLTESTHTEGFAKKFPERFFNVGVAEQNMAAIAAGLGVSGKIAFIASYATFNPGRNWEQIRTTIAYNNANVKIAGHHAGLFTGADGATHQAIEDIATMRVMPNMRVIVPCDALEAEKATYAAAQIPGPFYLRFSREATPVLTTRESGFIPGKAEIFWTSRKPACLIVGCGPLLYQALAAAKKLEKEKINTVVINCHTVKPLDSKTIIREAKKCGAVVSVEEHQTIGGVGGALSEALAREWPLPMEFIGMPDVFGESGLPSELIGKYGLDAESIIKAVKRVVQRKQ